MTQKDSYRLLRMDISEVDTSILHKKNPWLPIWWSAALPGLGHISSGFYTVGLILMSWEILLNFKAHINLAIMYTFTGEFEQAIKVLDPGWALFYGVVYCFTIHDIYNKRVELNLLAHLEHQQPQHYYKLTKMSSLGMNYLRQSNPWVAVFWSVMLTGFGHVYNGKVFKAVILLGWTVAIILFAHMNNAIVDTFNGRFSLAKETVNYQWLLFFPSIYMFAIWDAYNDTVEKNKVFAEAQKDYLRKLYNP